MLNDTNSYIKINKDPTKKLTSDIRDVLARWKSKDYITNSMYNSIYCSEGNLPRAYGLPKIHKPGHTFVVPLRETRDLFGILDELRVEIQGPLEDRSVFI